MIENALANSFNEIAEQYSKYRTGYPNEVIAEIFHLARLPPAALTACEIGCGTGQATLDFARKGVAISAVDPGKELLSLAVANLRDFPKVRFINSKIESATLPTSSFDLVFAAQSFHWVDPAIAYELVSRILKPGGLFVAFWKREAPGQHEPHNALNSLYRKYVPDYEPQSPEAFEQEAADRMQALIASKQFQSCQCRRFPQPEMTESAQEFVNSLGTWSAVARLDTKTRATLLIDAVRIVEAHGGEINSGAREVLMIHGYKDNK